MTHGKCESGNWVRVYCRSDWMTHTGRLLVPPPGSGSLEKLLEVSGQRPGRLICKLEGT